MLTVFTSDCTSYVYLSARPAAYKEPIVYNFAVAREVAKQVYIAEKLAPPTNLDTIRSAYEEFYSKGSSASWWRSIFESGEWKRVALYAIEAYGIFKLGEMIGRRWAAGFQLQVFLYLNMTDAYPFGVGQAHCRIQGRCARALISVCGDDRRASHGRTDGWMDGSKQHRRACHSILSRLVYSVKCMLRNRHALISYRIHPYGATSGHGPRPIPLTDGELER